VDNSIESKALWLFQNGYNCAESILKATEDVCDLDENDEITRMCSVLSNGMGIGCFCGALLVGMMLLGRLFDPATAKRLRIRLLWCFREKFPDFNCQALKNISEDGCDEAMAYVCYLIEEFISEEQLVV
jgi:C_GCAxxG_C_C family probable redox protein